MIKEPIIIDYKYDSTVDALSIKVKNYEHEASIQLSDEVIMDFNKNNEFIALKIINASHVLGVNEYSPENIHNISLFVNGIFTVPVSGHKEIKVTNASIANDINIPKLDTNLVTS
ncbi:MAG: DUF2283 domain-containing protein [Methanobacteriaceae archaeon]